VVEIKQPPRRGRGATRGPRSGQTRSAGTEPADVGVPAAPEPEGGES